MNILIFRLIKNHGIIKYFTFVDKLTIVIKNKNFINIIIIIIIIFLNRKRTF